MARTVSALETEIDQLEELLSSGATSVTIDGTTTNFRDTGAINERIRQLKNEIEILNGGTPQGIFKNVPLNHGGGF